MSVKKLAIGIPKEYNDMSKSEIAQLSVTLKKLVDDINYVFTQIDEENLSAEFINKLRTESRRITALENNKFRVSLEGTACSFTLDEEIGDRAVLIIPNAGFDYVYKQRGIYISSVEGATVTLSKSNKDYPWPEGLKLTVVLI